MHCIFLIHYVLAITLAFAIPLPQYEAPSDDTNGDIQAPQVISAISNEVPSLLASDTGVSTNSDGNPSDITTNAASSPYLIGADIGLGRGSGDVSGVEPGGESTLSDGERDAAMDERIRKMQERVAKGQRRLREMKTTLDGWREEDQRDLQFSNLKAQAIQISQSIGQSFQQIVSVTKGIHIENALKFTSDQIQQLAAKIVEKIQQGDQALANLDPFAIDKAILGFAGAVGIAMEGSALYSAAAAAVPQVLPAVVLLLL